MQRERIKILAVVIVIVSCQNVFAMGGKNWRQRFQSYRPAHLDSPGVRRRQEAKAGISPEDAQKIKERRSVFFEREPVRASGGTPKSLLTPQVAHLQPLERQHQKPIVTYMMDSTIGTRREAQKRPAFKKGNIFTHVTALGGPSPLSLAASPEFKEVGDSRSSGDELKVDGDQSSDLSEHSDVPYCEHQALKQKYELLARKYAFLQRQLHGQSTPSSGSLTRSLPGSRNLVGMVSSDEQEQ